MKLAVVGALVVLGLYFLLAHTPPVPLNHEAIGLGINHMMHSVFGALLLVAAALVWWKWNPKSGRSANGPTQNGPTA